MLPHPTPRATPQREAKLKRKRHYDDDAEVPQKRTSKPGRLSKELVPPPPEPVEEIDTASRVSARIELCDKMRELLTLYAEDIGLVDVDALEGCLIEMVCACTPSAAAHLRRQEMQELKAQLSSQWADVTTLQDEHNAILQDNTSTVQEHTAAVKRQATFQSEMRKWQEKQELQRQIDVQTILAAINRRPSSGPSAEAPPPWSPKPVELVLEPETINKEYQDVSSEVQTDPAPVLKQVVLSEVQTHERIVHKSHVRDIIDNIVIKVYDTAIAYGMPRWLLGD